MEYIDEFVCFTVVDGSKLIIPKAAIRNINNASGVHWLRYANETGEVSVRLLHTVDEVNEALASTIVACSANKE